MQPRILLISATLASLSFLPTAQAENFYAEGFVGAADSDDSTDVSYLSSILSGTIGVRGGITLNENFSLEGELQTGLNEEEIFVFPGETNTSLRTNAAVFGRVSLPVNERLNLYGRIGYASTEFSVDGESVDFIETFDGVAYGVGATFDLTDKIYLRGDATLYDT
ncbi:MAG: porin family protein, partial [Pseudomonadota bacterium]